MPNTSGFGALNDLDMNLTNIKQKLHNIHLLNDTVYEDFLSRETLNSSNIEFNDLTDKRAMATVTYLDGRNDLGSYSTMISEQLNNLDDQMEKVDAVLSNMFKEYKKSAPTAETVEADRH